MDPDKRLIQTRARVNKYRAMSISRFQDGSDFSPSISAKYSEIRSESSTDNGYQPASDLAADLTKIPEQEEVKDFEPDYSDVNRTAVYENVTPIKGIDSSAMDITLASDIVNEEIVHIDSDNNNASTVANDHTTVYIGETSNEIQEIRQWVVDYDINHVQLDKLLAILSKRLLPELPKSAKTFLQTSRAAYEIEKMEDYDGEMSAEFIYFGIEAGLRACVDEAVHVPDIIELQINADGLPLFKSSSQQMWPILGKIHFQPNIYNPFPIAVYVGCAKPKDIHLYLEKFIAEMNHLSKEGILIGEKLFGVRIKCFICDTPARSFLKCVKGHGGYYACERCTIRGERSNGRTIYPTTADSSKRNDISFRYHAQPEHHNGNTPLTILSPPIDMVHVCVLDSMHLSFGVMKKLLVEYWLGGHRRTKLDHRSKSELSRRMTSIKLQFPCEFQRKPGSIAFVAKWKATPFRFFLLYCGPIVLNNILSRPLYKHFLLLHVAFRILCTPELAVKYNSIADAYLKTFVTNLSRFYGPDSQVINMHNLLHIADDAKVMDCSLSEITAFPFENMLGKMKKLLRTPNRPLAQLCRRLHEVAISGEHTKKATIPAEIAVLKQGNSCSSAGSEGISIDQLKYSGFTLSRKPPNNIVLLKTDEVFEIEKMYAPKECLEAVTVVGNVCKIRKPIFKFPCNSTNLEMWELRCGETSTSKTVLIKDVCKKMVKLTLNIRPEEMPRVYVIPLLHN